MWEMLDLLEKRETQLCSSTPGDCRLGSGTFSRTKRGVFALRCFRLHKMNTWARARLKLTSLTSSICCWTTLAMGGVIKPY